MIAQLYCRCMTVVNALSRPVAYCCLALSMALVGSYVALSKPLAGLFPVLLLAWLRFGIGAVAMMRWLRASPDDEPVTPRTKWLLFLESFFGNFLFTLCMVTGVGLTSAVTAGVTMSAIPVAVAVLSWVILREQIARRTWAAVALAVAGIALYAAAKPHDAAGEQAYAWLGQLLLLAAVLCEAVYAVIGKLLTATLSPKRISAIINLWGFVLSTPFGLYFAWLFDFGAVQWPMWGLLLFYALAACVWTVWLWMTGLRAVPASQAGIFTVMLPISAALVGTLALGEQISGWQLLALGIALLGVVVATWPCKPAAQ
jgi:drug/metabolite transporter (DMT)-like permease